ncbi:hypothetical protein [Wolbachia endosymbiont (group A) of Phalera bucephala]|nr:hypothetical protein [Wolbachia endosymbiont (group A) of Phalera bucephala]
MSTLPSSGMTNLSFYSHLDDNLLLNSSKFNNLQLIIEVFN